MVYTTVKQNIPHQKGPTELKFKEEKSTIQDKINSVTDKLKLKIPNHNTISNCSDDALEKLQNFSNKKGRGVEAKKV